MRTHPVFLAAALLLCAAAFAHTSLRGQSASPYGTDQDPADTEQTVVLPTFTVESETVDRYRAADAVSAIRIRTQLIETPSSISVLTSDFLNDVKPVRLLDATRYVAGVQDGTATNFLDRQVIRGFISDGRTVDNFRDTTAHNFEEALIERVEVSKGPNALMAPGANPGGSLNIVTKSPQFQRSHSLTALVGEYDAQKVTLDLTDKIDAAGKFAYRLIAAYQDSERYWSSDSKLKRKLLAPQLAWRINETTDLVVKYHYFDTRIGREPFMIIDSSVVQRGQEPILGPGFRYKHRNGTPPWFELHYWVHNVQAQFSTSINKHITMRFAGLWQRAKEDSDQSFLTPPSMVSRYNPYTGIATPDQVWGLLDPSLPYDEVGNPYVATASPFYDPTAVPLRGERILKDFNEEHVVQNDWVFSFDLSHGVKSQTILGWAYRSGKSGTTRVNGTMNPMNLFDLGNYDDTPTWGTTPVRDTDNSAKATQFYLNQRFSFWEDRISITGGMLRYETETKTIDHATILPQSVLDDSKDMYMGSALLRLTPTASIYYSYSTNAAPAVVNLAALWREGKQHEYGVKTEFLNRRLALNAAYFEITQSNASIWNPAFVGGDFTAPQFFVTDYENHGAELEVTGALTRSLSLMGAYSYVKMRDPLGRHAISVAERTVSALLNYRFNEGPLARLNLHLGASYVGERAGDPTPVDYTPLGVLTQISFFLPSYTNWNAGATYNWSRYALSLSIDNLTDKKDFVKVGGARVSLPVATGRNVRLAMTVKF